MTIFDKSLFTCLDTLTLFANSLEGVNNYDEINFFL